MADRSFIIVFIKTLYEAPCAVLRPSHILYHLNNFTMTLRCRNYYYFIDNDTGLGLGLGSEGLPCLLGTTQLLCDGAGVTYSRLVVLIRECFYSPCSIWPCLETVFVVTAAGKVLLASRE